MQDLGYARVDLDRVRRCGRPEVIYCEGKLPDEVCGIAETLRQNDQLVLATRAEIAHFDAVRSRLPDAVFHERARCITVGTAAVRTESWRVGVVSAGTADLSVAEEAAIALEYFGWRVERIVDVGVAGLHRLLAETDRIRSCGVFIVAAGMEGALPGVVSGLVDKPVIALPTSVGYGANFGGLAALAGHVELLWQWGDGRQYRQRIWCGMRG